MALTTDELRIPETTAPEQAPQPTPPRRKSIIFGWAAVVGGVVAAGLLAALALTPDRAPSKVDTGRTIIEHGNVAAIDHRDQQAVALRAAMTRTVAEHGSVAAIDHRDQQAVALRTAMTRTVAEHGSVAAIDHRDQQAVAPHTAMTRTVAEHGSVAAIDHRDQQAIASAPR